MRVATKQNENPTIYRREKVAQKYESPADIDEHTRDEFDSQEVFELIRDIQDPEHPLTLEQLNVVQSSNITVSDVENQVKVYFTPTVPHCSMSQLIGLCIRVKLLRSLPRRFKVDIFVEPGTHSAEADVNKQLNDKERVAAALENTHLLSVINKCLMFTANNET